ncbi:hypothetical protein NX801_12930 [Streptomyces sp. LP05-1]|uniref:Integral membrane protein n=1 Tax=Streptomyces pyxinae TaxID=2970734 RepID=A0ABT2CGL0_9ACTN|nr:hypothetical protein [Streptomyces sp. LP05-1]MCS0636552.1 hypothetical protein [Streptomyces sp. LP05-1]
MFALRLILGTHPLVLLRRLLVVVAATGVGLLLLCALGYAVAHPGRPSASLPRLLWCALPLAAAAHFAVAVARADPVTRPRAGLSAVGLGSGRLSGLATAWTAFCCTVGSALALLVYLQLRGGPAGRAAGASELLAPGRQLPLPAALTLLALLPAVASVAVAVSLRSPRRPAGRSGARAGGTEEAADDGTPPAGLPWGVALLGAGLAAGAYTARTGAAPPPAGPAGSLGVLAGWLLSAAGLAVAGPGLAHLCGRLLQAGSPGPARLLAGRGLMEQARRVGRPLGVACAVAAATLAAATLYGSSGAVSLGPMTGLGAGLVVACTAATLLTAALETRRARLDTRDALLELGATAALLRTAVALRALVLLAVFAPLTWAVAALTVLPLTR